MCGFIGRIQNGPANRQRLPLTAGLPHLARRGPDSARVWQSNDERVELLHARLAIVDTDSRAHQPFRDENLGLTVVFNGELYNYHELRSELNGYEFRTTSDTEVILATYALQGIEGFRRFRGMFSLALADEKNGQVILARDPVGKKPLYLTNWNGDRLFGSSVFPLLAAHNQPVSLNVASAAYFWEKGFIYPAESVFADTKPLLPGQVLILDWNGREVAAADCTPRNTELYQGESWNEVEEKTRQLLEQAVARRLTNSVQPTALLSGGIDSTVVTRFAEQISRREGMPPLQALSLRSLVPLMNDDFYSRYAARKIGTRQQMVGISLRNPGTAVIQAFARQDEPIAVASYFMLAQLVQAASVYGKILLTGDGGDEVFLGYGKPEDWNSATHGPTSVPGGPPLVPCGPALPGWMSPWAQETVTNTLVGHMFVKTDRAAAEQGVEIRCPLLDWDVMAYMRSLPFPLLTAGNRAKALLKAQLPGWPGWFLERPKIGFGYNLRWLWAARRFDALRENIDPEAQHLFESRLPSVLMKPARHWATRDIFNHFSTAWKLLAWSCFLQKYKTVHTGVASIPAKTSVVSRGLVR
ncbi:MAG: hypothetical protein K1Y36_15175 [Blastocatellia bacterium]|nr:hypothetical protein [Blastocatellia bacterium]